MQNPRVFHNSVDNVCGKVDKYALLWKTPPTTVIRRNLMEQRCWLNLIEKKCPVCGKIFVPAPFHVYFRGDDVMCSWGCLNEYLRRKDKTRLRRQKRII